LTTATLTAITADSVAQSYAWFAPALPSDVIVAGISAVVDAVVGQLQRGGRLIYAGAGTSGQLAMLGAVECVPTFGTPSTLVQALLAGGPAAMSAGT
jgi:N-acetylmuramic acid 6-phosphate (MurNAc-6-P) etherase